MKSQDEEQKLTEAQSQAKKPRFKIEKLEERIAPGGFKHPGPHTGTGGGPGGAHGPPRSCARCM